MNKWVSVLTLTILAAAGCSKTPPPPAPPPPPPAPAAPAPVAEAEPDTSFGFTNTAEAVSADRIKGADRTSSVAADFNRDGLADLAVVEKTENDSGQQVSIYIQKPPDPTGEKPATTVYYKGGAIRQPPEGKIQGVMTRQRGGYTDLILLVSGAAGKPKMVHYRNDGQQFRAADLHGKVPGSTVTRDSLPLEETKAGKAR